MLKKLSISLLLLGCGNQPHHPSHLNEQINWINDPTHLPGATDTLTTELSTLPDTGAVKIPVWTGSWYPNSQNGTARIMEKYDKAVGNLNLEATNWEIQDSKKTAHISWAGHCNGLAAASTMTEEPKNPVTYNRITFTTDDIKALLVEAWQKGGQLVGGRCNLQSIPYDTYGRTLPDECRDLNPGTFHILLTNYLGRFKLPLIADIDPDLPVWNYPIVSYEITAKQLDLSAATVNYWLLDVSNKDKYEYNANAKSFAYIQMLISLANNTQKIYEYILELDENGKIIGGEWFRNSKTEHPDFLWRHTAPTAANPYLDVKKVYEIYNQSKTVTPEEPQEPGQNPK